MGQTVHPGHRTGWTAAAAAVAALSGSLLVTGCSSSVAAATTTLRQPAAVTVVHPDGATIRGVDGLKLHAGDVVRTGPGGRADLVTQSRTVYVGSQAGVQVVDGARQVLRSGAVVIDAQNGPGLDMSVASLTVSTPAGSAVRAERSVTVRVGTLAGDALLTSSAGREVSVAALHQLMVGGDALPDSTTPLRLTDDSGEARAVPDLVRDDRTLTGLARGIDATGRATARVVDASWHHGTLSAPPGVGRSERLLPAVIAAAGPASDALARYHSAVRFRSLGGSWGVIARLVGVRATGVVAALAHLERNQPAGHIGSVREVLAGFNAAGPGAHNGTTGPGGGSGPGDNDTNGGDGGNDGNDNGGNGPSPSPSPSPTPGGGIVNTVTDTVDDVLSLVPTPSPTRTGSPPNPLPSLSVPSLPVPEVTLPGLSPQH